MLKINDNYQKLPGSYLFSEIARRINAFTSSNPDKQVIRLSIGDVTLPLAPSIIKAMHYAVDEMGVKKSFKGYGPDFGYDFLRKAILEHDYRERGVKLEIDEIFISDGAKSDCGNIGDIFSVDNVVAVCDPVYPVYIDTNAMSGRAGEYDLAQGAWTKIVYMPCLKENSFLPQIPKEKVDIIYLCFPNNPMGTIATREQLKPWVDYAKENGSVILYDSAYEAFISDPDVPHSIYEIDGAQECAIEFRSFSKTAGFTGTRCAYTVVPKALIRGGQSLHAMWARRQSTKFNGVPYIIQRGAAAVFTSEGQSETKASIQYYMENARVIREGLTRAGLEVYGGMNAPYIWCRTPDSIPSWDFFDKLLKEAGVAATPGAGFGPSGEGYIRLTAFGDAEATRQAVAKVAAVL